MTAIIAATQRVLLNLFAALCCLFWVSCTSPKLLTSLRSVTDIDQYGGIHLDSSAADFFSCGFALGDILKISFPATNIVLPAVRSYRQVRAGAPALVVPDDAAKHLFATIYYGDFASSLAIAKRVLKHDGETSWRAYGNNEFPLSVCLSVVERGGFSAAVKTSDLRRSNKREDYESLSDAEFANIREILAPRIASGVLYRSSSPINPENGRATFADDFCREVGIRAIFNMGESESDAKAFAGYGATYYSTCDLFFRALGVDVTDKDFSKAIAEGLRFLLAHEPPYLIHCQEGQDRTGFLAAVLELLQGATLADVVADYMTTFVNYYGVKTGTAQYTALSDAILTNLTRAFGGNPAENPELKAEKFLNDAGLSHEEVYALKKRISGIK